MNLHRFGAYTDWFSIGSVYFTLSLEAIPMTLLTSLLRIVF